MEEALEQVKDPYLKKVLSGIWKRVEVTDIDKEAEKIKKRIIKTPKQPEQLVFAFIPHEMAKVSIFFPMSDKELKEERRVIHKLPPIESNWGRVEIEGVKLAIFEEDIFLALMKIAKDRISYVRGQYVLETTIPEIAKLLYGHAGYTKKVYERIKKSLDRFGLVTFRLTLFKKHKKEAKEIFIAAIVQRYDYNPKTHSLKIKFNPDFFAFFLESMLTGINFSLRRKLKKDGSKALLRFLSTHNSPSRMHILTVLKAINYNIEQPMYALRRKFKQFIMELKKQGVLGPKTKLYKDDTVYFDVLPAKKLLAD
ncbi:RepB family plasmid replication initiator protein [bacterium]|nr:RepB family plasmid replication initiator protein [bacterium]